MSGVFLAFGWLLMLLSLAALAAGEAYWEVLVQCLESILGRLFLGLLSLSFFFHFCHGMRHLIWDMGYRFALSKSQKDSQIELLLALLLTAFFWALAWLL